MVTRADSDPMPVSVEAGRALGPLRPAGAARSRSAREQAREHTDEAVRVLAEIMGDAAQKAADRVAAAKSLIQMGWGNDGTGEVRVGDTVHQHLHVEALRLRNAQDQHVRVIEHVRQGTSGVHDDS